MGGNNWLIEDYKIRCHNLQNKITPHKVKFGQITRRVTAIRKAQKCDELTAYEILKRQLEKELAEKREAENETER